MNVYVHVCECACACVCMHVCACVCVLVCTGMIVDSSANKIITEYAFMHYTRC